jgi:signal transduction histidine kinase
MKPDGRASFLERLVGLLPTRWPVRWRLTFVSAGLTFVILVAFALAVGRLASNRITGDFREELQASASELALEVRARRSVPPLEYLERVATVNDGAVRIVDGFGNPVRQSSRAPDLGPPEPGVVRAGQLEVATAVATPGTIPPLFVQYARARDDIATTIDRLWLLLALGVAAGTGLAALAGMAVAARAMRPISSLTAAAREITSTRDPSRRLPQPETDDEVAELARTLDQMLRELDAARTEREQMIQAQREFVADASHELRTPLTSILANLELLQERLHAFDEDGELVAGALRSSRRMSRLVSDLLLLARADAGRPSPRRPCDLAEIASAAIAEVEPVADGHALTLRADGPVPVDGNPDELHRLAVNLLDNGLRHTPEGTKIDVDVARRNGTAILEVSDDGPGVPERLGEQIFSRFVRGTGPADLTAGSGTGLGLAIVKAVATSHGGDVAAGASPKGGARFTVSLPLGSRSSSAPVGAAKS